ncbi:MAG: hypothetical protein NC204_05150 [Candidatus Amulumruptor caecigallinarius]|nr:hypothetical protein [Candidatus Amulumruptor caecigallinarius]
MITEEVIQEIYSKYKKPPHDLQELNVPYFIEMLRPFHQIEESDDEIIIGNEEEFNPFKRFLKRGIYGILEFDKYVAIVFKSHILFLSKKSDTVSVHMRPEKKTSLWDKIFGKA